MKKVDPRQSLPKLEEEVLKYWDEHKTFEKSVEKNPENKPFVFYEGPPTANGKPGLHHVLARAFKDIIPRYKTMKGYRVERKAGWDTHGLPVELQVEKALGLKNKQDIENIIPGDKRASIIEFNKRCKESVWEYKDLWEKMTRRMGYWVDMEHPYVTYDNRYIESLWWILSQISKVKNEKGESLLYRGRKIVPYCYRCGTALSSHEVAQGYQTVKDNSVYVKFKVVPGQKIGDFTTDENTYFLAWTTTPWTLPGNVALAINAEEQYWVLEVETDESDNLKTGEKIIFAQSTERNIWGNNLLPLEGRGQWQTTDQKTGKKILFNVATIGGVEHAASLVGIRYETLFDVASDDEKERAFKVVAGDFVTTDSGTGIVHIAPAFGEDDMNVAKENNLPVLMTVDEEGKVSANVPGKGILVKKKNEKNRYAVDDLIIEDLKQRDLFFKEKAYEHEYPFCWRCDTPLIYYAKPSWFIRMSELSDELVKQNTEIHWVPDHIKEGRFGEWLRGVKDWAISRDRYWGTPLPIWQCSQCDHVKVIESIDELTKLSGQTLEDVHRPYIDDVTFPCEKCKGVMTRTSEVMDVWFDSGAMPLAQFHYPFGAAEKDKEAIESGRYFPADYISEAIDQTRGWFYTLHAVATLLQKAGAVKTGHAYKNVICLAHILDAKGKKMSKSRGNVLDPFDLMNEFGADAVRWMLFTINQPGVPKRFDVKGMRDVQNRVFRMLWNSYSFFVMYAEIDKWEPNKEQVKSENLLDRWILSELQVLIREVDSKLEAYDVYGAGKAVEGFIDNLSNWYIRRSRKRFWKSEDDSDKNAAYQTLHTVLVALAKLMAPFTPFIAEEIYRNLTGEESVHLAEYPMVDETLLDEGLNQKMQDVRKFVTIGLSLRATNKVNVRQPLQSFVVKQELDFSLADIVKEELNVKEIVVDAALSTEVDFDWTITPELKLEGQARELIRFIQELRKAAGYDVENRIRLSYQGGENIFAAFGDMIAKEVLAESVSSEPLTEYDIEKTVKVDDEEVTLRLQRV
jgi:isoleucyl-tRNA synthetase